MPACPPPTELSSLLHGNLSASQAEELEQHVETCVSCQTTVQTLQPARDWLAEGVRAALTPAAVGEALEAACQEAISRIRKYAPEATAISGEAKTASLAHPSPRPTERTLKTAGKQPDADLGTIREYRLLSKLGEGGMGAVYKAQHTKLRRTVALKMLPASVANSPAVIARFEREMQAVGALDHEHIVRAFDAGESDGRHYLVMEYVKGRDLTQLCRDCSPLTIANACELIRQAAVGLQHAHEAGLVHRDIKPSNLMLSDTGVVKILDLGLALLSTAEGNSELTSTGMVMGTIDYMAPEQGGDTHHVDIRADIYSLGATLYRLLTGVAPFGDPKFDTPVKKLMALATQEATPIQQRRADIPPALAAVIAKMMGKSPHKRFATPAEAAAALAPFAAGGNLAELAARAAGDQGAAIAGEAETQPTVKSALVDTLHPAPALANFGNRYWNRFRSWPWYLRWPALSLLALLGGGTVAWALSGIVLLWETPNGTVRVVILDEKIQAQFDKDGLTIQGADKEPIKIIPASAKAKAFEKALPAGEHKLYITRGDFSFETDSFELKKNGKLTIKVELVANKVTATADGKKIGEQTLAASLAGEWTSGGGLRQSDFGTIRLIADGSEYRGAYSATYDKQPGELRLKSIGNRKFAGTWSESNQLRKGTLQAELSADGQTLRVDWEAADDEHTQASPSAKRGVSEWKRVGQQPNGSGTTLDEPHANDFARMFNDQDLTGWQTLRSGSIRWTNERGVITGRNRSGAPNSAGVLQSVRLYKDFHFRCEVLAGVASEPALLFRNVGKLIRGNRHGYALSNPAPTSPRLGEGWGYGSLYADEFQVPLWQSRLAPSSEKDLGVQTGDWYRLEVIARDETVEIRINGKRTVRYTSRDPALNRTGTFAIRCGAGATVAIRNVEIKELRLGEMEALEGPVSSAPSTAVAPFTAAEAKAHQFAWGKRLGLPTEITNGVGMTFRLIPPGEFLMGSSPAEIEAALASVAGIDNRHLRDCIRSEGPAHKVTLASPFYLGVHEVTQAQYAKLQGGNPSHFALSGEGQEAVAGLNTDAHPVEMVNWDDVQAFCAKLSARDQLAADATGGYTLPTEAQWEFACRAGTTTAYASGNEDEELKSLAWFSANSGGRTHAVGERGANPFGLCDMHGNVYEWTADAWAPDDYPHTAKSGAIHPTASDSAPTYRVLRGGDWLNGAALCRSAYRYGSGPADRGRYLGFRVALSVEAARKIVADQQLAPPAAAPFDAAQANAHQDAWAKQLGVPVDYANSIGMKFRLIPPGEFLMGSTPEQIEAALKAVPAPRWGEEWRDLIRSEAPQHKVVLTRPFYLGAHEVTQAQYEQVMGKNPSAFSSTGSSSKVAEGLETSNFPVDSTNWRDATEFCAALSQREKLPASYSGFAGNITQVKGTGYRLPTEAEWEFACRAGTTTQFYSGDSHEALREVAWCWPFSKRPHAVGELRPNAFGLFDMHGNVWEWVNDAWEPDSYAQFKDVPAIDPQGGSAPRSKRIFRSGTNALAFNHSRSANRNAGVAGEKFGDRGFRVALSVEAVREALAKLPLAGAKSEEEELESAQDIALTPTKLVTISAEIAAGKILAPDLSAVKPARVDEMDGQARDFRVVARSPRWRREYVAGKYLLENRGQGFSAFANPLTLSEGAIEFEIEFRSETPTQWTLALRSPSREVLISLTNEGGIDIISAEGQMVTQWQAKPANMPVGAVRHTLLLVLRNDKLETYLSGVAAVDPIPFPAAELPASTGMQLRTRGAGSVAIDRYRQFDPADLPR